MEKTTYPNLKKSYKKALRPPSMSGLSLVTFRISPRTSFQVFGLSAQCRLLFQVQNMRKPLRWHAITVSGLTMTRAERQAVQICEIWTQSILSQDRNLALRGTEHRRMLSWWRRAMISIWSSRLLANSKWWRKARKSRRYA
jgi:hypothetical protein